VAKLARTSAELTRRVPGFFGRTTKCIVSVLSDELPRIWGLILAGPSNPRTILGTHSQTIEKGIGKVQDALREKKRLSLPKFNLTADGTVKYLKQTPIMNFPHWARYRGHFHKRPTSRDGSAQQTEA